MHVGGIMGQTGLNAKVTECRTAAASGMEDVGGITGAVSYGTISKRTAEASERRRSQRSVASQD